MFNKYPVKKCKSSPFHYFGFTETLIVDKDYGIISLIATTQVDFDFYAKGGQVKIGLLQTNIHWEDKQENKLLIGRWLAELNRTGPVDWLIFPEMTLTGFSMDARAASLSAKDLDFFKKVAGEHDCAVTWGGALDGANQSLTVDARGEIIAIYAKTHLLSISGENLAYRAGDGPVSFRLGEMAITPFVCYDLRFAYLFWQRALQTHVYVGIANWPRRRIEHWRALLRARAIENQAYVIGVNRVGSDPQIEYNGHSLVVDPFGKIVLDCGESAGLYTVEIDRAVVDKLRSGLPFLQDRKKIEFAAKATKT